MKRDYYLEKKYEYREIEPGTFERVGKEETVGRFRLHEVLVDKGLKHATEMIMVEDEYKELYSPFYHVFIGKYNGEETISPWDFYTEEEVIAAVDKDHYQVTYGLSLNPETGYWEGGY